MTLAKVDFESTSESVPVGFQALLEANNVDKRRLQQVRAHQFRVGSMQFCGAAMLTKAGLHKIQADQFYLCSVRFQGLLLLTTVALKTVITSVTPGFHALRTGDPDNCAPSRKQVNWFHRGWYC